MECALGRDITLIYQYLDLGFLNLKLLLTMKFTVNGYLLEALLLEITEWFFKAP
jgi:hypothetical protein